MKHLHERELKPKGVCDSCDAFWSYEEKNFGGEFESPLESEIEKDG